MPQAFLTAIFFDERFNFIPAADGGVAQQQVAASVGSNGSSLTLANIKAPKNGYAFIYISNQSNNDVYFDNLQVGIVQGNIAEENHYYSYGLKIATLSSKKLGDSYEGTLKNNYLYNDKELFDDADLNWYDYGFRNYDPQIGRFTQLDPLTDSYPFLTPYQYASCEPIGNVDVDGLEAGLSTTAETAITLSEVVAKNTPKAIATVAKSGGFWHSVGRFLKGAWSGLKETVSFAINVFNPDPSKNSLVQTGKFLYKVATDPVGTFKAIKTAIQNTDWDDPYTYGKIFSMIVTPVGGVKVVKYLSKATKAAEAMEVAQVVEESGTVKPGMVESGVSEAKNAELIVKKVSNKTDEVVAKNGSTAANKLGQEMHKAYKAEDVVKDVAEKEFTLPSGRRVDFIDFKNKTIYELKPNNARAIRQGNKQLEIYKKEVEEIYGPGWKTVLDKY